MRKLAGSAASRLIIAVSHDDYALYFGGVQTLIADEQTACNRVGWNYLHVSPAAPLPVLADPLPADAFMVRLRLDGTLVGVATLADLLKTVAGRREQGGDADLVCHHLMGHAPELVADLAEATGSERPICWLHDFFTLCPSYTLLRNDVAFCWAPGLVSQACTICCYGEERVRHSERMARFFETTYPHVLSPSEGALDFWLSKATLRHADHWVLPHARLVMAQTPSDIAADGERIPLRIAYLGAPVIHKGWHVFSGLASAFGDDARYTFLQLGSQRPPDLPDSVRHIPVTVSRTDRYAMVEALAEARVDVAVLWPLCFESFCYTAHEAIAAGVFVLTHVDAGNVWPAVARNAPTQGHIIADEQGLFELFDAGGLRTLFDYAGRRRGALIPGGGTVTWLRERDAWSTVTPASFIEYSQSSPEANG